MYSYNPKLIAANRGLFFQFSCKSNCFRKMKFSVLLVVWLLKHLFFYSLCYVYCIQYKDTTHHALFYILKQLHICNYISY